MSTKIVKGKDIEGNVYYSDMPVKNFNAILSTNVSTGTVNVIQAGRVVTVVIKDLTLANDMTARTLIATNLPKPFMWLMSVGFTNLGAATHVGLYLDINGNLYIEASPKITKSQRLIGTFTYISNALS